MFCEFEKHCKFKSIEQCYYCFTGKIKTMNKLKNLCRWIECDKMNQCEKQLTEQEFNQRFNNCLVLLKTKPHLFITSR